jgi:hypothetical protein
MARGTRRAKGEVTLTKALSTLLAKTLVPDLRDRAKSPKITTALRLSYEREREARRTADTFEQWVARTVEQVGAAWVLSVVFVRTLEDRDLLDHRRIAGEGATDSEQMFFEMCPSLTARDYLMTVFREQSNLPGAKDVFDAKHNPVWRLSPSNDGVRALLDFFRERDGSNALRWTFTGSDTRFLGDLYQDLSKEVRKRYALLQTPRFVERFILDQTLEPAIDEFGLDGIRIIDPTCGSGHFLLGALHRIFEHRMRAQPGVAPREHATRALTQVYGIDLNPYAVAIARFRMTLAYLEYAGISKLRQAPPIQTNLVVADSLYHAGAWKQRPLSAAAESDHWGDAAFRLEEPELAASVFGQKYHVVVGNPPFINCKDAALRELYRERYESAAGKYALAAPFTELFFQLAVDGGFVGLINSNSFMKREFGQALVERVLPHVDLTEIVDTSGAYLPGHGTPTVILFGRSREPVADAVRAVMGKRGEQEEPRDPASAPVWSEIVAHHEDLGFDGAHISVEAISRAELAQHPWILAGGGARGLYKEIGAAGKLALANIVEEVGYASFPGMNGAFVMPAHAARKTGVPERFVRTFIAGEAVRDWEFQSREAAIAPYGDRHELVELAALEEGRRHFWAYRTTVLSTTDFGGATRGESGDPYWSWYRWQPTRYAAPVRIVFPYVSTHNHFALDRGGRVFNQHAPVIILKPGFGESDYEALLGYLNSSLVGFWCRLVMFPKGGDEMGDGARLSTTQWNRYLEYAGNLLQLLPVPELGRLRAALLDLVVAAGAIVRQMGEATSEVALAAALAPDPTVAGLRAARDRMVATRAKLRGILASLQEEIDWRVYGLFGLATVTAPSVAAVAVPIEPQHRPFEVRLAREVTSDISASEWFRIHGRTPPGDVAGPLADLYRQRLRLIDDPAEGKRLRLLEVPENKRRWPREDDAAAFTTVARDWLLERMEQVFRDMPQPEVVTVHRLAVCLGGDRRVQAVHELLTEETGHDLVMLLSHLADAEGVPFLSALRYSETGLVKRGEWEACWDLQRAADERRLGEELKAKQLEAIPVPGEYVTGDFQRHYWGLRGELDVPKERYISYPGCERGEDRSSVIGWAAWNHLERAQALAALYQERVRDAWPKERLAPLLAGILELVTWLKQWHNAPHPSFDGERMGDVYEGFVDTQSRRHGLTLDDLRNWRPAEKNTAKKAREAKAAAKAAKESADTQSVAPKKPRKPRTKKRVEA